MKKRNQDGLSHKSRKRNLALTTSTVHRCLNESQLSDITPYQYRIHFSSSSSTRMLSQDGDNDVDVRLNSSEKASILTISVVALYPFVSFNVLLRTSSDDLVRDHSQDSTDRVSLHCRRRSNGYKIVDIFHSRFDLYYCFFSNKMG